MYFKNSIEGIGCTPLVELSNINPNPGVRIFAKLEGQNLGGSGSVKDRIVKHMIEEAEGSGHLKSDKILIEATSGNTGISLAWIGRLKGYRVKIIMPESMSLERRRLIHIMGAELILTPGQQGMNGAIAKAREMVGSSDKYYMLDQFSNPANPKAHYTTTANEIINDMPVDELDALVCTIGTGGTIVGLSQRLKKVYSNLRIIGVEPYAHDPIQGLRCIDDTNMPAVMDLRLVDQRTTVSSADAENYTLKLLENEGIFAGISSGAAACQAVKTARNMNEGILVTILPDGGWKYLSLNCWDRLPK